MVFHSAKESQTTKVTALIPDGSTRDVTDLARFVSNNPSTATIDKQGLVTAGQHGDTFVFARFNRFTIGSEVIVLPAEANYCWTNPPANNYVDEFVYDRLQKLHLLPSELADDETFVRRVYLDLAGVPPTPEQYQAFLADKSPKKREALIDQLIASDDFADLWTAIWAESLRIMGGGYAPTARM